MTDALAQDIRDRLFSGGRVWLFLDYDGTLAVFARTPDEIIPDEHIIDLLTRLAQHPGLRVVVVSGRRLSHIQRLLPVPGITLAGTYGIELQLPQEAQINRVEYAAVRPALNELKPRWEALIEGRNGFYLEDKGWALALHARFASDEEAAQVLEEAHELLHSLVDEAGKDEPFQVMGGHKFLEIGPAPADKGTAVEELLRRQPWPGAHLVYIGDDDKDEKAFAAVHLHGGTAILVAASPRSTLADARLGSPMEVRGWLESLLD